MTRLFPLSLSAAAADNRQALSTAEFRRIADLLLQEAGIELSEGKLQLVQSRLGVRLRSLGLGSYGQYCAFIEGPDGQAERLEMLSVLTTNVTRFFREPHHFDFLRQGMIPDLLAHLRTGGSVRIWSAGCASGEEPYSLALTFLGAAPDIARYDFKILASDIDPAILRTAAAGVFSGRALAQVPQEQRDTYFTRMTDRPDHWHVAPELRSLIAFRRLNLIADWPFTHRFDVIMCRNVVIYFGTETKARVWSRLLDQLRPGGWLITGHSERLPDQISHDAELLHTTTYRRRRPSAPKPKETSTCH